MPHSPPPTHTHLYVHDVCSHSTLYYKHARTCTLTQCIVICIHTDTCTQIYSHSAMCCRHTHTHTRSLQTWDFYMWFEESDSILIVDMTSYVEWMLQIKYICTHRHYTPTDILRILPVPCTGLYLQKTLNCWQRIHRENLPLFACTDLSLRWNKSEPYIHAIYTVWYSTVWYTWNPQDQTFCLVISNLC